MNTNTKISRVKVICHPSLALIKYWGKADTQKNIPATTSIALGLEDFCTNTEIEFSEQDKVFLDGKEQDILRYKKFFDNARLVYKTDKCFFVQSENNFPSSAGFASSSSGFAAIAYGIKALSISENANKEQIVFSKDCLNDISSVARLGSASAARSVFGGITILRANSLFAQQLYTKDYWPNLRILAVVVSKSQKKTSSRDAMESTRLSSPYYEAWLNDSKIISTKALEAIAKKDFDELGKLTRLSYSRMHCSAMSANPPIFYWEAKSLELIKLCEELRENGIRAYETMDAGPQVKILCLKENIDEIKKIINQKYPELNCIESRIGGDVEVEFLNE